MILRKCFKAKRKFMHIAYVNSSLAKKKYRREKIFAYLHFNLLRPWLGVLDLFSAFGFNCQ